MSKARLAGMIGAGALLVLMLGIGARMPQAQVSNPGGSASEAQAQTQALRDLVAEVRALRAVIESYTAGQAQTQTLGSVLTVQQQRVSELNGRLEATRRELEGVSMNTRRLADEVQRSEDVTRRTQDSAERTRLEAQSRATREELERLNQQELQLRSRESELSGLQSSEENKLNELVDRINRSIAR